jgi:uncharacterized membrane protein YeiH
VPDTPFLPFVDLPVAAYYFELVGTAIFAITGVLVVARRGLDMFGALTLGMVTALGGGTARDVMIEAPIFWFGDVNYVWAAIAGALLAFWIGSFFRSTYSALLYLDGLGGALFAIAAASKVLTMGYSGPLAVLMGVLTGIGGGLIRDVLAGRPTLLRSRDIYATPILFGCTIFVLLRGMTDAFGYAGFIGAASIFGVRAAAIYWHLQMPSWLTHQE